MSTSASLDQLSVSVMLSIDLNKDSIHEHLFFYPFLLFRDHISELLFGYESCMVKCGNMELFINLG